MYAPKSNLSRAFAVFAITQTVWIAFLLLNKCCFPMVERDYRAGIFVVLFLSVTIATNKLWGKVAVQEKDADAE